MKALTSNMYTETAHLLLEHPGACAHIHGHSYKWTVQVVSEYTRNGMVMDFSELKKLMKEVIDPYDHALIVDAISFKKLEGLREDVAFANMVDFGGRPTAENMAQKVYTELSKLLPTGVNVDFVTCRETRNNEATYYESE